MYANYHTHTKRCQHAVGEDREYVEAAIAAGIQVLGFSDHCPWVYKDDFVSGIRMRADQVEEYVDSMQRLRTEYRNDIRILIGFETEHMPDLIEAQDELLAPYPIDYMILGQHFLKQERDGVYTGAPTTDETTLQNYVDTVIAGLESGRYLYLAHPDLINYVGDAAIYERHMTRLCQYLKEHDRPIELNMLGAVDGRHYPSKRFLDIASKVHNKAIIGIDQAVQRWRTDAPQDGAGNYNYRANGGSMRLRNIKGADERILADPYTIQTDGTDGADFKGRWNREYFHNDHPIHIEIGMGKGQFITTLAQQNPNINYIGIEKYSSVLIRAIDKREELALDNLLFMRMDAEEITDYFEPGEVGRIYLNFSDPWPKDRHAKRRLTSTTFLSRYDQILQRDGVVEFKTDNCPLFDFSLEQLQEAGWHADYVSYHLHENGPAADNIMTEYEQKFYALGNPICKFRAHR